MHNVINRFMISKQNIKDCYKLYNYFVDLPINKVDDDIKYFLTNCDDKVIIKKFIDILICAKYRAINNINKLVFNNKNVSFIKEEAITIREDSFFLDELNINSSEYHIYNSLFNSRNYDFNYLIMNNHNLFDNPFIKENIFDIVNFLDENGKDIYPLYRVLCHKKDFYYKDVVLSILNRQSEKRKKIFLQLLPIEFKDELSFDEIIYDYNINKNSSIFLKNMDKLANNLSKEEYIKHIESIISGVRPRLNFNLFLKLINDFDNKKILTDYYLNANNNYFDRFNDFGLENNINFNNHIFDNYFKYRYNFTIKEDNLYYLITNFILYDLNGNVVISCYKVRNELYIEQDNIDKIDYFGLHSSYIYHLINIIENNEEFNKEKEEKEKELKIKNEEKEYNDLLDMFNNIEDSVLNNEFSYDFKAHLDYFIYEHNDKYYLELKIGNNKRSYVVKDIKTFVNYFLDNKEFKYGKDLVFVHNKNNFIESDQSFIDFLLQRNEYNFNGRYLMLNDLLLQTLFTILDNKIINFNNNDFIIKNELNDFKIDLNSDYSLSYNKKENDYFLILQNSVYFVNNNDNVIQRIYDKNLPLIKLLSKYENKSLLKVKDEFKNRIYPIFKDIINIDDSIKNEFNTSSLFIDSYIDFDDNKINLNYKFRKNDEEINEFDNVIDKSLFKRYCSILNKIGFNEDLIIMDQDSILNFFKLDLSILKKFGNIYLSEILNNKKVETFAPPTIRMNYSNGMMKVFMNESIYDKEELESILLALKQKRKFVLLKNNTIIELDKESNKFKDLIDDLSIDKKDLFKEVHIPLYKSLGIDLDSNKLVKDEFLTKMVDDIRNFKNKKIDLPLLSTSLREYQRFGYNWLKILSSYNLGGILADDMGLGKTIMTISLLVSDENNEPSLIVSPTSLVFNWMNEFNKFSIDTNVKFIYGNQKERENMILNIKEDEKIIYLTSYDSLRNDIELYKNKFNFVILDEAQYIKNVYALKTINVKKINAKHRFCLTGTPIENDIFDLWSLFDFLMPSYLPSLNKFKKYGNDEVFIKNIKRKVAPFILRRTKKEVLSDLPPKSEKIISCKLVNEQRKLYDATCLKASNLIKNNNSKFEVLSLLTRLRQICVDPLTFIDDYKGESSKMNLLFDIIDDYINKNRKMLIFSQFVSALDIIEKHLKEKNINYFVITGKTNSKDRIDFVNEFNANKDIHVFLVSLKAGGNGLNLTGADTVIHLDPWWNVSVENQATDRAHRIGQVNNVEVIKLICEDSVEQRVIELQNKKKELIDSLISDDTSLIEKMSLDDLNYILR